MNFSFFRWAMFSNFLLAYYAKVYYLYTQIFGRIELISI
jgi:hypothetical protein